MTHAQAKARATFLTVDLGYPTCGGWVVEALSRHQAAWLWSPQPQRYV